MTRDAVRQSHDPDGWLKGKDRLTVYEAATAKKKKVTLSDGRTFSIKYDTQDSIAWGKHDVVYLSLADGSFGPCGWFHVSRLKSKVK